MAEKKNSFNCIPIHKNICFCSQEYTTSPNYSLQISYSKPPSLTYSSYGSSNNTRRRNKFLQMQYIYLPYIFDIAKQTINNQILNRENIIDEEEVYKDHVKLSKKISRRNTIYAEGTICMCGWINNLL